MNFGGYGGDVHGPLYIFCLLFKNTVKVQEHDLYLNQILDHSDLKKNPRINNKNLRKGAPGAALLVLYEVSSN